MTMNDAPTRPAIYVRISRDQEKLGKGVERQREDCEALVARRGWGEPTIYEDNDISAYSGKRRPSYERLLADLRSGRVDAVVVWHTDRLHRSTKELEAFIDIIESTKARVEAVTMDGPIDLATPSGRLNARFLGAVARFESEHKGERQKRQHLQRATEGRPNRTGVRPFGYALDWSAVIPDEAALIREAAARILAGDSLRGICADWNQRGLTTTTGGRWQQSPLRKLLTAGRNAAISEYFGSEPQPGRVGRRRRPIGDKVGEGQWPAILDEATVERLRAILRDPSRRTSTINARAYLLTGYLACSECGKPLRARPRLDKVRRYVCASGPMYAGCGKIAILAEPLETLVSEMVLHRIDTAAFVDALDERPTHDDGAEAEALAADRAALVELSEDYYQHKAISRPEFQVNRAALEKRIGERVARLSSASATRVLEPLRGAGGDLRALWATHGFDQQRAVIGALVDRIVVGPAVRGRNRFDPTRVTPEWRV